jgi:hypothetical protein
MRTSRFFVRLLPALLLAGGIAASTGVARAADRAIAHIDGYLSVNNGCLVLRQHDGALLSLVGGTAGLLGGDHVRLEGRMVPDPGCGAQGFAVATVQTVWGDDNHRTTVYDHLSGEPFAHFAERTGRFDDHGARARGYEGERRGQAGERGGPIDERERERDARAAIPDRDAAEPGRRLDEQDARGRDYDRDHDRQVVQDQEPPRQRLDRNGRYVYQGAHRSVTLVGKIHETQGACPTLETSRTSFALDGDLGDYQAGDRVRVSGMLYDQDPGAPCGGPTVVIRRIRGH